MPLATVKILLPMLLLLASASGPAGHGIAGEPQQITRIAFGSCSRQSSKQPLWKPINAARPELFLFLGDNIYGDTDNMETLRKKYAQQDAVAGYQQLRRHTRVLATWDDHDFGRNDAGAEYEQRAASQQVFLDFFREPEDSERRKQQGVFGEWQFGEPGSVVQVILLDTRYHRSALSDLPKRKWPQGKDYLGPYQPSIDPNATILGESQWQWLREKLRKPADLRVLGTSIQLIPNAHAWEKWGNFPAERKRFFQLIRETRANGIVLLSGDRHHAEVSCMPADHPSHGVGYPIYEFTSSGLTHSRKSSPDSLDTHRIHPVFREKNFGLIQINWATRALTIEIRNDVGKPAITTNIGIDELIFPASNR